MSEWKRAADFVVDALIWLVAVILMSPIIIAVLKNFARVWKD